MVPFPPFVAVFLELKNILDRFKDSDRSRGDTYMTFANMF